MLSSHLLSLLIWLPILGAIAVLFCGRNANAARWLALAVALATFVISIPLWTGYNIQGGGMQFIENMPWIAALKANYALGADGISVALIVLTTITTVLVVIGSWGPIEERVAATIRWMQSGYLYHYAFAMILGLIALLGGVWWVVTHGAA